MKWLYFLMISLLLSCGKNEQATLLLDAQAQLGEGAFWHEGAKKLFWIDIEGQKLHVFDPFRHTDSVYDMGARIGTVVPTPDASKALVALQYGVQLFDLQTGGFTPLSHPIDTLQSVMRYNDGKCDPQGRFWVGGMHLEQITGAASLYCIHPNGAWRKALPNVSISNGIVWNATADTMYYIDTPSMSIKAFPYNNTTGLLGEGKIAVTIPNGMGYPDGMAIDEHGMLWVGMWAGYGVTQWNPHTGELLRKIEVPAPNVTSCAFGGTSGRTLYITTAREGLSEEQLRQYPQSGGVFAVEVEVKAPQMTYFTPL